MLFIVQFLFGDDSGELSVEGVNKASAIEVLINHLGIPKENTYAFGDGMNDVDMLEYCQYGIAVGNAKDGLKAIADEGTDDIVDDGIYNSMKKHSLI
ncbi:MAG: HAD-IIB family hydrolase [Coprobacillus sp.]